MGALPTPLSPYCVIKMVIQTVLCFGDEENCSQAGCKHGTPNYPEEGGGLRVQGGQAALAMLLQPIQLVLLILEE